MLYTLYCKTTTGTEGIMVDPESGTTKGAPRWVKVFGIIIAILVLLFVVLMLTGGPGRHGPGRHGGWGGIRSAATALST